MPGHTDARLWGRLFFAVQSVGGAAWWIGVFALPVVRETTLGSLPPVPVAAFDVPLFVLGSALAALGLRWAAVVAASWTVLVTVALAISATVTTEAGVGVLLMGAASAGSLAALCLVLWGRIPTEWVIRGPFAFRPARSRAAGGGARRHVVGTFAQIVVFWGFFLVTVPIVLALLEGRWGVELPLSPLTTGILRGVGIVVLVAASALGLWSGAIMSTLGDGTPLPAAMPNRLVVRGPYRWVRNPMALSGIVQGVAVGLILPSWLVVVYAVAGSLLWNYAVRPHEESDLAARFGPEFAAYRAAVRCWLPRMPAPAPASRPAPSVPRA